MGRGVNGCHVLWIQLKHEVNQPRPPPPASAKNLWYLSSDTKYEFGATQCTKLVFAFCAAFVQIRVANLRAQTPVAKPASSRSSSFFVPAIHPQLRAHITHRQLAHVAYRWGDPEGEAASRVLNALDR